MSVKYIESEYDLGNQCLLGYICICLSCHTVASHCLAPNGCRLLMSNAHSRHRQGKWHTPTHLVWTHKVLCCQSLGMNNQTYKMNRICKSCSLKWCFCQTFGLCCLWKILICCNLKDTVSSPVLLLSLHVKCTEHTKPEQILLCLYCTGIKQWKIKTNKKLSL